MRRSEFEKIKKLGFLWQKLTHAASKNSELILGAFKNNQNDPLVSQMVKIYKETISPSSTQ